MKTRNLLTTLSVAALAAMTLNLSAGEALLTPRAKEQQTRIVPAVATDRNLAIENRNLTIAPRALENRPKVVKATPNSVDLAHPKCATLASPKQLDTFGKATAAGCCRMLAARCTPVGACCAMN